MKSKLILNCLVAIFFALSGTANAALTEIDCKVFNAAPEEGKANLVYMLDGILSAGGESTITSIAWLDTLFNHTVNYCSKNPNSTFDNVSDVLPDYPENSEDIDMDTIPCSTLAATEPVAQTQIVTWWTGFSAGFYGISLADNSMTEFAQSYGAFCSSNPNAIPSDFLVNYFE